MLSGDGEFYAAHLRNQQSEINSLSLREKGSNETSNPFTLLSETGKGYVVASSLPTEPSHPRSLVSVTFQQHVYIAQGDEVIVVSLETNNTVYERISVGHEPLLIRVYELSGSLLMFVHYSHNSRGYIATYRFAPGLGWSKYGRPILVYSPVWYDIDKISNVIVFEAQDNVHLSRTTIYAAVAYQWKVHITALIDTNNFHLVVPEPCDNIVRLNFNDHSQALFIECLEVTVYSVFSEELYYTSELWGGTDASFGLTSFSEKGRFGAVMSNSNSTLAVVELHISEDSARYFTLNTTGDVDQLGFVTINDSHHYVCYVEFTSLHREGGVHWVHVEGALASPNAVQTASGLLMSTDVGRHQLSVHDTLLAVTREGGCDDEGLCERVILHDMRTLTDNWRIHGVNPLIQAWRPHPQPVVIVTTPEPDNEPETMPPDNSTLAPNPVNETEAPTQSTDDRTQPPTLPPQDQSCEADLHAAREAYDRLFWVTVVVCVSFCLAMVVSISLLAVMMFVTRHSAHCVTECTNCTHVSASETKHLSP